MKNYFRKILPPQNNYPPHSVSVLGEELVEEAAF